jgi:hypothetical protein
MAMITAANGNAGTVYLRFQATQPANQQVQSREQTMIPLKSGVSVTFEGVGRGSAAPEMLVFGTGYSYAMTDATATTRRLIFTYYEYV